MAEQFKTYTTSVPTSDNIEHVIIGETTSGNRASGMVAQIHSLYISQNRKTNRTTENGSDSRYNPANFSAFDLYIKKGDEKIYIVYDGRVVPGSPFFIEKNITLETDQSLCISCPQNSWDYDISTKTPIRLNQDENIYIDVVASTVLFPAAS